MKTIIAALDFSSVSERVFALAAEIAKSQNATVYLLHVVHSLQEVYVGFSLANQEYYGSMGPLYIPDDIIISQLRNQAKEEEGKLMELRARALEEDIDCHALLLQGEVPKVLIEESKRLEADLCIMGTHGHSLIYKALLGSTTEYVMGKTTCPVVLVPRKCTSTPKEQD